VTFCVVGVGDQSIGLMSKSGAACFLSCRVGMTLGVSLEMADRCSDLTSVGVSVCRRGRGSSSVDCWRERLLVIQWEFQLVYHSESW